MSNSHTNTYYNRKEKRFKDIDDERAETYSFSCYICGKRKKEKGIEKYDYGKKKKIKICKSCNEVKLVIFK